MQLAMSGDDWLSDRDKKRTSKAIATRAKAGLACSKQLLEAVHSLQAYLRACNDCCDGSGDEQRGYGDGRRIMIENLMEYSTYLGGLYDR